MALPDLSTERREAEMRLPMSYDEYRSIPDPIQAEWIDGEGIIFTPHTTRHQEVLGFLAMLLGMYDDVHHLGNMLFVPYEVQLIPGRISREADLLFATNEHAHRFAEERFEGAPDLIVEVISDDSVHRDRVDKFDEYEAAGVREYWVIDPRLEHQSCKRV